MTIDYSFLLQKDSAEEFLNQYSETIFGSPKTVQIIDFKRAYTYNSDSYNVFYHISVSGQERKIRVSTSRVIDKKPFYEVLSFFYQNGFNAGDILVAEPLTYITDKNILIYEHVEGTVLMEKLNSEIGALQKWIKQAAMALKKIHSLPKPDFETWDYKRFFYFNSTERGALKKYYPDIEEILNQTITKITELIEKNKQAVVCHGDYQPANLLLAGDKMYILDLDLVSLLDQEYDVTVFVNQLFYMIKRFGNVENFDGLKAIFLENYGPVNSEKTTYYETLINLRTLATFCLSQGREENTEFMPLVYKNLQKNLEQLKNFK